MASDAQKRDPRHSRPSAGDEPTPAPTQRAPAPAEPDRDVDEGYWSTDAAEQPGFLRRHPALKIAVSLLLLCAVGGVAFVAGSLLGYLNNSLDLQSHDRATVNAVRRHLTAVRPGVPVTVLMFGSDRSQPRGPGHVDSILLARLDSAHHRVALLFIPRDLRTQVPGHGMQTVAAAYRLGGPALALETVKSLTHVPINHFLDVDFRGFIDIVDALGGVRTTVPTGLGPAPGPSWAAASLQPGYHLLDGIRQCLVKNDGYLRSPEQSSLARRRSSQTERQRPQAAMQSSSWCFSFSEFAMPSRGSCPIGKSCGAGNQLRDRSQPDVAHEVLIKAGRLSSRRDRKVPVLRWRLSVGRRAAQPVLEANGPQARAVTGRQRLVVELGAEVAGPDVCDHLPLVVLAAKILPGDRIEGDLLWATDLDSAVHRRADRNIGQRGCDIIGRDGL